MTFAEKITELKKEIPYRWRVQGNNADKTKVSCVAYIDARDAMDRLDEVFGPENWQDDYKTLNGVLYAGVGLKNDNGEWVWKWDAGAKSDIEVEKGEASDAFKRANVKWGLGRYLYSLEVKWVPAKLDAKGKAYPVDEQGQRVWDLTEHFNRTVKPKTNEDKINDLERALDNKMSLSQEERINRDIGYMAKMNRLSEVKSKLTSMGLDDWRKADKKQASTLIGWLMEASKQR